MFEDSTFASRAQHNPRRGWTAVVSFGLQAVVLGIAVLAPLLYTEALPALMSVVDIPPPPGRQALPQTPRHASHPRPANPIEDAFVQPRSIPTHVTQIIDRFQVEDPDTEIGVVGMPPGVGRNSQALNNLLSATSHPAAPAPALHPTSIRLSGGVTEGLLMLKVKPTYPKLAIMAHQQGSVILQATIGRDGTIENLHAVSGPSLLIQAAIDAVKQWRYRPYLLDNQPVEVETQITVNFNLGG